MKGFIWKFLPLSSKGEEIEAILTIITNYEQAFKDLNNPSSKEFVAKFAEEVI